MRKVNNTSDCMRVEMALFEYIYTTYKMNCIHANQVGANSTLLCLSNIEYFRIIGYFSSSFDEYIILSEYFMSYSFSYSLHHLSTQFNYNF